MTKCKRLKDPIYGYINIDEYIITNIIDTSVFQRLRNIIQTSYSPLYSSAVHNRFVHFLGVYYLGCIAARNIEEDVILCQEIDEYSRYLRIFEIACLLHDVGHAPFSHTGEIYYLENGERTKLHEEIIELTNDKKLESEIKGKNYKAAPHELMSVIVALRNFSFFFENDEEKSFFARCILGYSYTIEHSLTYSFLNCVISLLNSSVIDVDKLDYLIRDAFITGFDTVNIDYMRLLQSIKLIKKNEELILVYKKSAISVIENVVYAHDAERKWIQNHPIVQYEAYLLQGAINLLNSKYMNTNLFSYNALTENGVSISDEYKIILLSDADIIFLMKNLGSFYEKEYFQRNGRRHPLWKSEAEYKAIFTLGYADNIFEIIENGLEGLCKYLNYVCKAQEINEKALAACQKDIEDVKKLIKIAPENKAKIEEMVLEKKKHLKWLEALQKFADESHIPFDFVILKADQFNSGFSKESFGNIQIEFDTMQNPCYFRKVTNSLKADKSDREKFFYLFYRKKGEERTINLKDLAISLGNIAMQEAFADM